jgi:hypothetical protein
VALLKKGELIAVKNTENVAAEELRDFYLEMTGDSMVEKFRMGVPA